MKYFGIVLIVILCSALTLQKHAFGTTATKKTGEFEELRNSYKKPVYENILDLYWRTSQLDIKNTEHLDLYLILTECEISKQFFKDDQDD